MQIRATLEIDYLLFDYTNRRATVGFLYGLCLLWSAALCGLFLNDAVQSVLDNRCNRLPVRHITLVCSPYDCKVESAQHRCVVACLCGVHPCKTVRLPCAFATSPAPPPSVICLCPSIVDRASPPRYKQWHNRRTGRELYSPPDSGCLYNSFEQS